VHGGEEIYNLIFNNISEGVFTVNKQCIITSFNNAAEHITGFRASEAIGNHCFEIFRTKICHRQCALKQTLQDAEPVENSRITIITKHECEVPIRVTTNLLRNKAGDVVGAVEFFRDISEEEHMRQSLVSKRGIEDIVTRNPEMQRIVSLLPDIAESECNVLIEGPSGSGKELVAQVIHNLSPRKFGPYIKINCGALPAQLLESELFGYEKGAFTDAKGNKPGQFSLANGGTLLLDEISEMDVSLQVKLLRVLNNGEYQPLGSTKTQKTDARIISATNSTIEQQVAMQKFRKDLYYRINVVKIEVPPLRSRPEDIPMLVDHFIELYRQKRRRPIHGISHEALRIMMNHSFPGNVRELENAIEHTFVMCRDEKIQPHHLPTHILETENGDLSSADEVIEETAIIKEALKRFGGNKTKAAKYLNMHRTTLWRKLRIMGID
jgi:PAS domain S-box-containing protein